MHTYSDEFRDFYVNVHVTFTKYAPALTGEYELDDWINRISGVMTVSMQDSPELEIGRLEAYQSNLNAIDASGENLWYAFDAHSQDLSDVISAVAESNGELWVFTPVRRDDNASKRTAL